MSARITQLDSGLLQRIFLTWKASLPNMLDQDRVAQAIFAPIQEPNTHWYRLPQDSFLLLRQTEPKNCASVQILTRSGELIIDPAATREVLREAMREFQLNRLSAVVPSPLPWRDYKLLGFKHEGRVRKSVRFNGEWTDAEIMGALASEVGIPRRRKRNRRHKKGANQEGSNPESGRELPKETAGAED
jgi:hypothetical protein